MAKPPGIILTSQYTIPNAKSFTTYIDYCTREKALLKTDRELTPTELRELHRVQEAKYHVDMEVGGVHSSVKNKKTSDKEGEAKVILSSPELFQSSQDFEKYVSYMGRSYALKSKQKISLSEKEELDLLEKHMADLTPDKQMEDGKKEILSGVFSKNKSNITQKDLSDIKGIVGEAQKNGSVYYQDVVSFDTDFLIQNKLYDPRTDTLDENRIQNASRKMMEQLFKDEHIEENNGFWFASIHRNTKHIHIHFGTVEHENRRQLVTTEIDGVVYYEPKGKRKQKTLDNMKSTFAHSLVDRTNELSRISTLRNDLVQEIKGELKESREKKQPKDVVLLREIYAGLPSNKKDWAYGSKRMPEETRNKIDQLTSLLMKDNPVFKEYKESVKNESEFQKGLYGDTARDNKDYEKNQIRDVYKRMGNSLLKELKKKKPYDENPMYRFQQKNEQIKKKYEDENRQSDKESKRYSKYKPPVLSKKDIRNIERVIDDDLRKLRAERDYERVQQQIAREQEMGY
ncbi:MobP2 family relaxase [Bacillus sp. SIMBA_074]|uniref:MobP2 family relaxase n=1 Tax=Bacillus sp. SIMBA_074 TaxID=3085812 RepID=UPI00397C904C